jgi:HD-like signal output (HDOD) protein
LRHTFSQRRIVHEFMRGGSTAWFNVEPPRRYPDMVQTDLATSTESAAVPLAPTLAAALPDLASWTAWLRAAEIPVLADTAAALEAMRAREDEIDANGLGEMIANDPLMTLKVLAYASSHRGRRMVTDTETVTATLVMMGITPFFEAFGPQPTVEERLAREPEALAGLRATVRRTHRGANFALGFAVHRMDPDAAVVHAVALLHEFADLLLWCHAPALLLRIQALQRADPDLRSAAAQQRVLNVEVADLQAALMRAWRLPELLTHMGDDLHAENANVRSVELGARLARHTARGWDNPAVPDDVAAIAELLNLSIPAALQLVREI